MTKESTSAVVLADACETLTSAKIMATDFVGCTPTQNVETIDGALKKESTPIQFPPDQSLHYSLQ